MDKRPGCREVLMVLERVKGDVAREQSVTIDEEEGALVPLTPERLTPEKEEPDLTPAERKLSLPAPLALPQPHIDDSATTGLSYHHSPRDLPPGDLSSNRNLYYAFVFSKLFFPMYLSSPFLPHPVLLSIFILCSYFELLW
ncbi:hypothetical protein BT69DRAFT_1344844 [Atractiella rhizophila]|nr:hypothetical protein BT69DRAFT_1344844 [Atractiella rhizophila]